MGYQIDKFEITSGKHTIPVAVHTLSNGEETTYAVSIEGFENFEIACDNEQKWRAEPADIISTELLDKITLHWTKI